VVLCIRKFENTGFVIFEGADKVVIAVTLTQFLRAAAIAGREIFAECEAGWEDGGVASRFITPAKPSP
jgi:hypothetical protein